MSQQEESSNNYKALASDQSVSSARGVSRGGRGRGRGGRKGNRSGLSGSTNDAESSLSPATSAALPATTDTRYGSRGGSIGGGRASGRSNSNRGGGRGRGDASSRGRSSHRSGGGRSTRGGGGRSGRGRGSKPPAQDTENEAPENTEVAASYSGSHVREYKQDSTSTSVNNSTKEEKTERSNQSNEKPANDFKGGFVNSNLNSSRGGRGRTGGRGRAKFSGRYSRRHDHSHTDKADGLATTTDEEAVSVSAETTSTTTTVPAQNHGRPPRGSGRGRWARGGGGGRGGRGRSTSRGRGERGGRGSAAGRFGKVKQDGMADANSVGGAAAATTSDKGHQDESIMVVEDNLATAVAEGAPEEVEEEEVYVQDTISNENDELDEDEKRELSPVEEQEGAEEEIKKIHPPDQGMLANQDFEAEPVLSLLHPEESPAIAPGTATLSTNDRKTCRGVLSLPALPPRPNGVGTGKLVILSRSNAAARDPDVTASEEQPATTEDQAKPTKKKKTKRKGKKMAAAEDEDEAEEVRQEQPDAETDPVSTTDAIKALPAQEVSITADTAVKRRARNESSTSSSLDASQGLVHPGIIDPKLAKKGKGGKPKKKKKGLSNDTEANRKAVQQFNRLVHQCVMQSDPEGMREILHNPRNHNFALDALVLETVMKAYIMAAMFEDALYCLRHCALPGTLQTIQTERILLCLPQNLRNSSAYTAADMISALCVATDFDTPTSRTYFLRIVRGIALEFLEEATSARDRICSAPCERLVRAGLCVVNAHLERGKKTGELIVMARDQLGVFVPDTLENRGIQAGDAVSVLPYAGPYPMSAESLDRNMIEAIVTNTNPIVLRLQDKANANLYSMLTEPLPGNVYRIDKLANRMGFNRQLAAAVAIASPLGDPPLRDPRRPSPELVRAITAMDENIDLVMRASLGGKLPKGEMTSTAALCSQAIPWNADAENEDMDQDAIRSEVRLALEKYGALQDLNGSQRLAVEGATSNRLTLVQGPPGTGKTMVAIRILQYWAKLTAASTVKGETPPPILATSDSNIAVDNLVEGCAGVGLKVVRLGRPEAIRPELLRFCIDRPASAYSNEGGGGTSGSSNAGAHRERLKQMRTAIKEAQVICCTCIGSGGDLLDGLQFERVLVDEATQATEPAVLVPLIRGCRQLVLVGDHCQLPPTVLSTRAEEEGHGVPLFSRMVACGVPPYMLDTQYRMHPRIAMFPSDLFYGGLLMNGVSAPERRPLAGFPWPAEEFPVAFIPIRGVEMDDGVSKYNEDEARAACDAVGMLLSGGQCQVSDIAVVTPYAAQAKLIRRMTRSLQENRGPPFIEVSSVDGFQGREKEAVVFSAVRSNDYGSIGFTSDWRRVNVSFTRARRALIVIGNDTTLRRGDPDTWGPWLAWADAHGLNMDKPGVPRGRYDPEQLRRVRGGTTAAEMLKDVLERQQAQLKNAEKQQERAVKNAMGHIRATSEYHSEAVGVSGGKSLTLEEDLAQMENADGHWDDSDEEDNGNLHYSVQKQTSTSRSSQHRNGEDDESSAVLDVWDL